MQRDPSRTPVYSMGVAERLTGLTGRQIRYWEQHGLVQPTRTKGKQRLYSEADLARLKEIKGLLADGLKMEQIKAHYAAKEAEARLQSRAQGSRGEGPGTAARLDRQPRVTSLYPLTNREELMRYIDRDRERE